MEQQLEFMVRSPFRVLLLLLRSGELGRRHGEIKIMVERRQEDDTRAYRKRERLNGGGKEWSGGGG